MGFSDQSFQQRFATMGDSETRAWVAGLFEGEGWVGYNASSNVIHIQLVSTDECVIDLLLAVVGYGHKYIESRETVKQKTVYKFSVHRKDETVLFRDWIYELLSPRRQEQFDIAFTKRAEHAAGRHERHVAAGYAAAKARWGYEPV